MLEKDGWTKMDWEKRQKEIAGTWFIIL